MNGEIHTSPSITARNRLTRVSIHVYMSVIEMCNTVFSLSIHMNKSEFLFTGVQKITSCWPRNQQCRVGSVGRGWGYCSRVCSVKGG